MNKLQHTFYTRKNTLSDRSVVWEVWQAGSDQRLASAATEAQAEDLVYRMNKLLSVWTDSNIDNTIDC